MIFCAQPYLKPCFMCYFYILSTCPFKGLCTALRHLIGKTQRFGHFKLPPLTTPAFSANAVHSWKIVNARSTTSDPGPIRPTFDDLSTPSFVGERQFRFTWPRLNFPAPTRSCVLSPPVISAFLYPSESAHQSHTRSFRVSSYIFVQTHPK